MPVNRTYPEPEAKALLPLGLLCRACGLRSVGVRECGCCGDLWLVCDGCEVAHARLSEAA